MSRGQQMIQYMGEYYVLDILRNSVVDYGVNLDELEAHLLGQPAGPPSSRESDLSR